MSPFKIAKKQKGYTLVELLIVLAFVAIAAVMVGLVGTVIWALIRVVSNLT